MLVPSQIPNENSPIEILVPVKIKKREEAVSLDTLYFREDAQGVDYFVYKYESDGLVFVLQLEHYRDSGYEVLLKTEKLGYTDLEGMNVFKYINSLKKVLSSMSNAGQTVKKLYFQHIHHFHTKTQIIIIRDYLKGKIIESRLDEAPEILISFFLSEFLKDKNPSKETIDLANLFGNADAHKEFDKAKDRRYKLFSKAIERAFRKEIAAGGVVMDKSLKPNFTLTFTGT
jgi:hypothetical protein